MLNVKYVQPVMPKPIRDFNPPNKKVAAVPHTKRGLWDDLTTPVLISKKIVGKEPADVAYRGGMVQAFSDSADNAVAFNAQLRHAYREGSDIEFHIHAVLPKAGAGSGVENIKFDFTYSWSNIDAVVPAETTVNTTIDVQDYAAHTHYLITIKDIIAGVGKTISSVIICSLTRDVGVANNYEDDIYLVSLDFHYERDTNGSRTIDLK